ncbi:MAG TPA: PIN domain-containing protein [Solirubrobacterales bacterium]|nr:PIN domain-containing protein [Solirubrobacterales bacterium]
MALYLADTSIWAWSRKAERNDIREKLAARYEQGGIVTCVPVILEAMHRPETTAGYRREFESLFAPLERVPLSDSSVERALAVQRELAEASNGSHRRPAIDFLIAAAAEAAGSDVVLWCFDRDLRVICEHTGQPCECEFSTGPGH